MAISLPIVLGFQFGNFEVGLALALGALLSSPSDVSGSQRHKNFGIILSTILAVLASLVGGYLAFDSWFWLPVLGAIMFFISYLAVFGFRASLISFSGLFAMVLSFSETSGEIQIYERALLIGVGGIWYLGLTFFWQKINPTGQTDQYLAETLALTSQYIKTRGNLIHAENNRNENLNRLLELQADLNEKHETLRDILISARKTSGSSGFERKRLMIFIQLVDILELAMANPVNYEKMDLLMNRHREQILNFQDLIFEMANRLQSLSVFMENGKLSHSQNLLKEKLAKVKEGIEQYKQETEHYPDEGIILLHNLFDYQERQVEKINKVEQLLLNSKLGDIGLIKKDEVVGFITPQEYNPKILIENLSLKSSIFKHSLRLAIVVMAGYAIGEYFSLQNAYWILLTIIVIMRPNYGLTKTRSKQRTAGTLIGAGISIGIVLLTQNVIFYSVLAIISLVVAFAMVQKNYKTSATFVTISVVFVYAILEPNVLDVIQFRVIDTLIGAALATVGNIFLWPSWEFLGIQTMISESIKANKDYFKEVITFYENKGKIPSSYKLSRKHAFLGIGNLSTSFQRMTQEPKSKQKNLDNFYELVALNHSFLSSLASLGTYIQNQNTTPISTHFKTYSTGIEMNLESALKLLNSETPLENKNKAVQHQAEKFFDERLHSIKTGQYITPKKEISTGTELQEAQLVYEHLKWLMELSEKLKKKIAETNF